MNDDELLRQLRSIVPPETDSTAQERARQRALTALRNMEPEGNAASSRHGWLWTWAGAGAAALLLVGGLLLSRPSVSHPKTSGEAALLAQIQSEFPGELNAVIEQNGKVELALGDRPGPEPDQPLLVEFRRGNAVVRVLSYSGHHVCLDLGGRSACFEALIDDDGKVIVAGEDFVASPALGEKAHGWEVVARSLAHSS